jgi:hypothetical protein
MWARGYFCRSSGAGVNVADEVAQYAAQQGNEDEDFKISNRKALNTPSFSWGYADFYDFVISINKCLAAEPRKVGELPASIRATIAAR